jgi:hypothetical protein
MYGLLFGGGVRQRGMTLLRGFWKRIVAQIPHLRKKASQEGDGMCLTSAEQLKSGNRMVLPQYGKSTIFSVFKIERTFLRPFSACHRLNR